MTVLYLDTTNEESIVQLWQSNKILSEIQWVSGRTLGDNLLPEIEKLMNSQNLNLSDLNLIAVNPGPGSFTGTRIGVTTANAIAWSNNIPVVAAQADELSSIKFKDTVYSQAVMPKYSSPPSVTVRNNQ